MKGVKAVNYKKKSLAVFREKEAHPFHQMSYIFNLLHNG